jgi:DNA replication licensing factor MCM7
MEQQTISIAKAGITTTLNARAAVLAAANPLYGRYNKRRSISENVDLPNSLLSRFDLLFLILDKADTENDLALSRHVLHVHKYLRNPDKSFTPLPPSAIKQYISYARQFQPTVPPDLSSYIVEAYVNLRSQDGHGPGSRSRAGSNDQAVMTARQLLSMLRLSQALARLRLSETISHEDVDEAIRLTHASKSSLQDDGPMNASAQEDVMSQIYSIIRDYANQQRNRGRVEYSQVCQLSAYIFYKPYSNL